MTHQPSSIKHSIKGGSAFGGQSSKICPYPGLRAFEEEESLYFKGRERPIDEIMGKLAANKFLLLTGKGQLTIDQRKFIIETTFKCLTKIDDNRAIRNLMIIDEITEMLEKNKYTIDQVAEVIKPFRMHRKTRSCMV